MRTFDEVGGDFLDYFLLSDGMLGIYVCDVVGKGLPAALYAALAAGTLRSIKKTGEEPSAVLELFNKRLLVRPVPVRYCASQYAVFDPRTLELRLGNAGLPLSLHLLKTVARPLEKAAYPPASSIPRLMIKLLFAWLRETRSCSPLTACPKPRMSTASSLACRA